ncbi:MAG: translation elongation factor Ts, partial [Actinomycetota bacterium]|nr:translation elongation factor Ts [Actinomycetota bacterium]
MANITAVDVKKLRDATGAGMMDSKNALVQADGDLDQAVEILRIKGEGKARRRGAERTATAGLVATAGNAMVELNSETDFVAKSDQFQHLGDVLAGAAAAVRPADRASLAAAELSDGRTVERAVSELAAVIGEKIELGRVAYFDGKVATYMHRRASDLPPAVG